MDPSRSDSLKIQKPPGSSSELLLLPFSRVQWEEEQIYSKDLVTLPLPRRTTTSHKCVDKSVWLQITIEPTPELRMCEC